MKGEKKLTGNVKHDTVIDIEEKKYIYTKDKRKTRFCGLSKTSFITVKGIMKKYSQFMSKIENFLFHSNVRVT